MLMTITENGLFRLKKVEEKWQKKILKFVKEKHVGQIRTGRARRRKLQDRFVPFGPVSRRRTLPWLRAKHKLAIQSKHLAFVQYKSSPSAYTFRVYREESNKLPKLMQKSRRKYEKQLALKARIWPVPFFTHVRRNRHLKINLIGWKDNEGETIFTPSTQGKLLKEFYSHIFCEDEKSLAPTVLMPVPQFSTPVIHRERF